MRRKREHMTPAEKERSDLRGPKHPKARTSKPAPPPPERWTVSPDYPYTVFYKPDPNNIIRITRVEPHPIYLPDAVARRLAQFISLLPEVVDVLLRTVAHTKPGAGVQFVEMSEAVRSDADALLKRIAKCRPGMVKVVDVQVRAGGRLLVPMDSKKLKPETQRRIKTALEKAGFTMANRPK